jgi:hypothetical protein
MLIAWTDRVMRLWGSPCDQSGSPPPSCSPPLWPSPASQSVVLADGRHPVFLKTVEPYRQTITFDLVQWYEGQAAAREAAKDHLEADNDYYIRNSSSKLRTLPVLDGATITVNQLTGSNQGVPVSLAKLSTWFPRATAGPMFWITVHDGHVSQISEQWVP